MNIFFTCIALLVIILVCMVIVNKAKNYSDKQEAERIEKEAEKQRIKKEREEAILKEQKEWKKLLEQRSNEYGSLTKQIGIGYKRENNIYVYEESKTIFIMNQRYQFSDIISCEIEKSLHKKGRTIQTTTPDKFEMAEQQVLWGMGQKYNVKSTTRIEKNPDIYKYVVYIGINSISNPQIQFTLSSIDVANEVKNLINVIVNQNNKSNQ